MKGQQRATTSTRLTLLVITLACLLAAGLSSIMSRSTSAAQDDSLRLNPKPKQSRSKTEDNPKRAVQRLVEEQDEPLQAAPYSAGLVIEWNAGQAVCRDATEEETRAMQARDLEELLRALNREETASAQSQEGMKIILRGTNQLEQFPAAKAAFIRAAGRWEAMIQSPITLVIDVDYGPTRFGQPFGGVLGSTDVQFIGSIQNYPATRAALIERASNAQEAALYNLLPQSQIPTDIGATAGMFGPSAVFRALGRLNPVANPDGEQQQLGPPPSVGFNSAHQFDFNPDDGIEPGKYDFDAVATHEIGHALGFSSNAGTKEVVPSFPGGPSPWDLFRFRPGITTSQFSTAQRVQSSGGEQIFFGGGAEVRLSTGRPDGSGGDGRQCSHWKDDTLNGGVYLGIMDPVLPAGIRVEMTQNDLIALDLMGYQLRTSPNPTPTPSGDTVALTSGVAKTGSIPAPPSGSATLGQTQFTIQVPIGATQLKIDLSGNTDVDLYARFGNRITIQGGAPLADFKSESTAGNESITITSSASPALQAGTYYIAVGNYGPVAASFTVMATVTGGGTPTPTPTPGGDTVALTSGVAKTGGPIPAPQQSGGGTLGATQYLIQVPNEATQLNVNLNGNQDVDLFVRFNNRIAIQNGSIVADFRSDSPAGNESVIISNGSSPALQAGVYYIGIVNFGPGAANFTVTATVNGGGTPTPTPTPQPGNRVVRVGQASGSPGGQASVPIELIAQGNENALGFSLTFDPAVLGNPQASLGNDAAGATLNANTSQLGSGRLGIALSLPFGQKFNAGTRQIVVVSFAIAAGTSVSSTQIGFSDQPIAREISDVNAGTLQANFTPGAVSLTSGFEADVAPRPNGNGSVTITDWVQIGRFVAGQDAPSASEFQRADAAPRETRGNGNLSITDWVQAGRYAAGLDAPVPASGPSNPGGGFASIRATGHTPMDTASGVRQVRISSGQFEPGQQSSVIIELDAEGNENALGFSLNFNPAQLRFITAALGKDTTGATLNINTSMMTKGSIGVALALPAGQTLPAGRRKLILINFAVETESQTATIGFGDQPVARELSDAHANPLPVDFINGILTMARSVTSVSAASFTAQALASEAIVAAFGQNLATQLAVANTLPLPTSLAGTTIMVRDNAGQERMAPLFFVAPTQVNYQIPADTAVGEATVIITSGDGRVSTGMVNIASVGPGLFSAASSGQGVAAAVVLRVKANGAQSYEPTAQFDAAWGRFVAMPIDLGGESDQVFLLLYGSGFRHHNGLAGVTVILGDVETAALFAGEVREYAGLDQLNLRIPRNLAGRGEVDVSVNVNGHESNRVKIHVK